MRRRLIIIFTRFFLTPILAAIIFFLSRLWPDSDESTSPDEASTDFSTIPGPTVLFWIVCLALNAMAEPSGSISGSGYEPHWLLRMSPLVALF
ncbi:hypothetical protein PG985_003800 [Apiospora marii]|uniref:uncharacterized protein n=1 Tax=Apiospora marii TaxID=335849 RepID=UPI00312EC385